MLFLVEIGGLLGRVCGDVGGVVHALLLLDQHCLFLLQGVLQLSDDGLVLLVFALSG